MIPDCKEALVNQFRGSWSRLDPYAVPIENGLYAQNVDYENGLVRTRFGHSDILPINNTVTGFIGWLFNVLGVQKNWFFYYASGIGIRAVDLAAIGSGAFTWIAQTTAYTAIFAPAGSRIYIAFISSTGAADTAAQVFSYFGSNDPLFAGPIATSVTLTEPSAGLVTAGTHKIGYLITTRNGFTTRPSPAPSNVFTPGSIASAGSKIINVNINPASWPSYASSVQIIMSTVANPNTYYLVPGATAAVPGGSPLSVNIPVSISDSDLALGIDAAPYLELLVTNLAGTPPFIPYFLFTYSNRMGYLTLDSAGNPVCYFSDSDNYQAVTADQSPVYLPGNLPITCGAGMRGVAYLFGPHWTYASADDGNTPVNWAKPQSVDGAIGTLCPRGVSANPSQGYMWVMDIGGLYLFQGGKYSSRPISYYQQSEWNSINWAAAATMSVVDDVVHNRVQVLVALNGATSPTHRFVWDYSEGTDPEHAKFSPRVFASGFSMGSFGYIQNPTTRLLEVWLGPSSNDSVIRENSGTESNPYRDRSAAIDSYYETTPLPGGKVSRASVKQHCGGHLKIQGVGSLAMTVYNLDRTTSSSLVALALSLTPGKEYLKQFLLTSEQCSVRFGTNAVDQHFQLAQYRHYYTLGAPRR